MQGIGTVKEEMTLQGPNLPSHAEQPLSSFVKVVVLPQLHEVHIEDTH